eukprot:3800001-Amphidinium_carterae.1
MMTNSSVSAALQLIAVQSTAKPKLFQGRFSTSDLSVGRPYLFYLAALQQEGYLCKGLCEACSGLRTYSSTFGLSSELQQRCAWLDCRLCSTLLWMSPGSKAALAGWHEHALEQTPSRC